MKGLLSRCQRALDRFLFESCEPIMASVLRVAYASLLVIYTIVWMLDASRWFSNDGVLSVDAAQQLSRIPYWSIFFINSSETAVWFGLVALLIQSCLLLVGFYSRFQVACIFVWLASFQHRNPLICDGEDTVIRLFAFFFIFLPLDHAWSLSNKFRRVPSKPDSRSSAWGLRLIQVEMTAIYLSAGWSKLSGATWRDGTAMYYVMRMDDHFGRGWLPEWAFDSMGLIRFATWTALAIELALPFALWIGPTRRFAIFMGIAFHLAIELSMDLFLFEWIMMIGLLSFIQPKSRSIREV